MRPGYSRSKDTKRNISRLWDVSCYNSVNLHAVWFAVQCLAYSGICFTAESYKTISNRYSRPSPRPHISQSTTWVTWRFYVAVFFHLPCVLRWLTIWCYKYRYVESTVNVCLPLTVPFSFMQALLLHVNVCMIVLFLLKWSSQAGSFFELHT